MSSKMSYNDRERLKNDIRARLAMAKVQIEDALQIEDVLKEQGMSVSRIPTQSVRPVKQMTQKKKIKRLNNNVSGNQPHLQTMQGQMQQSVSESQNMSGQNRQEFNDEFNNKFDNKPEFERYDCGHPYPKMTVKDHIKKDISSGYRERISNLQYAFVMSEILSEPLSKRKRRNKRNYSI